VPSQGAAFFAAERVNAMGEKDATGLWVRISSAWIAAFSCSEWHSVCAWVWLKYPLEGSSGLEQIEQVLAWRWASMLALESKESGAIMAGEKTKNEKKVKQPAPLGRRS